MLKTSRVLLRVAAIVSTVVGALILAMTPVFLVIGFSSTIHDMLLEAAKDGTITVHSDAGLSYEQMINIFQITFVITGFLLLVIGGICVANALIASRARNNPSKKLYIACIITGALSTDFSLVAGIFGLISLSRAQSHKNIEE